MHALPLQYTMHTNTRIATWALILGVRVCAYKCGSVSVKRDDLLTLQSFTAWLPNTFLTFYWKGHSWLAKRWHTPKPFRNKAYSHKQTNCKDVWTNGGADNSQALFIACSNDVCKYLFEINEKPISEYAQCLGASLIGSITNTWYHEHRKGCRGRTEEQRISHSPTRNLQERKVRSDASLACFAPRIHNAYKHTDRNMSANIGSYSM